MKLYTERSNLSSGAVKFDGVHYFPYNSRPSECLTLILNQAKHYCGEVCEYNQLKEAAELP